MPHHSSDNLYTTLLGPSVEARSNESWRYAFFSYMLARFNNIITLWLTYWYWDQIFTGTGDVIGIQYQKLRKFKKVNERSRIEHALPESHIESSREPTH